jgi:hypothetical protein
MSSPRISRLSELAPEPTEWLWHLRIPKGELTVVDGDPSVNKSSVLLDLVARVSTGRGMPDGTPGTHGGVLLVIGEDSIRKTVLQRLRAAGGDLDRVAVPSRPVLLPRDLRLLEECVATVQAKLVVIDPVMAFLDCDANGDQKVRRALTPLKDFAERSAVAVVMVRHLTKRGGQQAIYRGGGSVGIIAATRSALLVAKAPSEPNLRVLCHLKSNLGPLAPSLMFEPVAGEDGTVQVEWRGECDYTADDLLARPTTDAGRLAEAMTFLTGLLAGGPVPQREVKVKAVSAGMAYRTVERAKEILGVVTERRGWGPGSTCFWRLPPEADHPDDGHSTPPAPVALYVPGAAESEVQGETDDTCPADGQTDCPAHRVIAEGAPHGGS